MGVIPVSVIPVGVISVGVIPWALFPVGVIQGGRYSVLSYSFYVYRHLIYTDISSTTAIGLHRHLVYTDVNTLILSNAQRTNNTVKSWHARFQISIVTLHSYSIWKYIEYIKKDQRESEVMITQLTGTC
jgi:hypothetical protein